MGAMQNDGSSSRKQGPASPKTFKGAARSKTFSAGRASEIYDGCDPATLRRIATGLSAIGGAVLFGATRDGGACAITLFAFDDRVRVYPTSPEQMDLFGEEVSEWLAGDPKGLDYWYSH